VFLLHVSQPWSAQIQALRAAPNDSERPKEPSYTCTDISIVIDMVTTTNLHIVLSSFFCFTLIVCRCGYRLFSKCRTHITCHRKWHLDDTLMALALIPLITRSICISKSTELIDSENVHEVILGRKLLLPGRLMYASL
jgi:hypothetical protein